MLAVRTSWLSGGVALLGYLFRGYCALIRLRAARPGWLCGLLRARRFSSSKKGGFSLLLYASCGCGVVELEGVFELGHHGLVSLDVHAQVMRLGQLGDQVSQLTAAPVFTRWI